MYKTENRDSGSLKVGVNGDGLKVGDTLFINGKAMKISWIMGKGEKMCCCFKGCGPVPTGEVTWSRSSRESIPTPPVNNTAPDVVVTETGGYVVGDDVEFV